jgi:zinc protease
VNEAELTSSKINLIRIYPQEFETNADVAAKLREMIVYGLPEDEWATYTDRVAAVDAAAATRAAKERLRPDALLVVVVGDRAKIEPGIRELNLGEVVELSAAE